MRIAVLDANYPSDTNLYGDVFVHIRVVHYIALGHEVRVIAFFKNEPGFTFEGVDVRCVPDVTSLNAAISEFRPDVVAIHFFQGWMLKKVVQGLRSPIVIWVHGIEALGWYRRLFNFALTREFYEYVKYSTIAQTRFRKLLRYAGRLRGRIHFVFISDWMRRIAERDSLSQAAHYSIIPNPIDQRRFPYTPKAELQRTRVLMIRSFSSRKYANDIAVAAIRKLSTLPEFGDFQFSIHGSGSMFGDLTAEIGEFSNVSVREGFLTHEQIRALHASHGVFLCPTRQDAQGVSMCEAMSSGLVSISSHSTAIPEFLTHGVTGFLTRGPDDIVRALLELRARPEVFRRMSAAATESIIRKAGIDRVVEEEVSVMKSASRHG